METRCRTCGVRIPHARVGSRMEFCGERCRQQWRRAARRRVEPGPTTSDLVRANLLASLEWLRQRLEADLAARGPVLPSGRPNPSADELARVLADIARMRPVTDLDTGPDTDRDP